MKRIQATILAMIVGFFCLLQGSSIVAGWNKYILLAMRIVYTFVIIWVCAAWGSTLITKENKPKEEKNDDENYY